MLLIFQASGFEKEMFKFFLPGDYREYFILGSLSLLFLSGCLALRRARQKFDREEQEAPSGSERWVRIVPGLLLTFGLLGTFIGIGLAISNLETVFEARGNTPEAIKGILGQLGLKFKCSVWGISFNFIFRVLQSWVGLDAIRGRKRQTAEKSKWEKLEGQTEDLNKGLVSLNEQVTQLVGFTADVRDSIDTISSSARLMQEAAVKLSASATSFQQSVGQFEVKIEGVMNKARETLEQMGVNLQNSTNKMSTQLESTFTKFSTDVRTTLKEIEGNMQSVTAGIKTSQKESTAEIRGSTEQLRASVIILTDTTTRQATDFQASLSHLKEYMSEVASATELLHHTMAEQSHVLETLQQNTDKLAEVSGDAFFKSSDHVEKMALALERITQSLGPNAAPPSSNGDLK